MSLKTAHIALITNSHLFSLLPARTARVFTPLLPVNTQVTLARHSLRQWAAGGVEEVHFLPNDNVWEGPALLKLAGVADPQPLNDYSVMTGQASGIRFFSRVAGSDSASMTAALFAANDIFKSRERQPVNFIFGQGNAFVSLPPPLEALEKSKLLEGGPAAVIVSRITIEELVASGISGNKVGESGAMHRITSINLELAKQKPVDFRETGYVVINSALIDRLCNDWKILFQDKIDGRVPKDLTPELLSYLFSRTKPTIHHWHLPIFTARALKNWEDLEFVYEKEHVPFDQKQIAETALGTFSSLGIQSAYDYYVRP